ncbi:MAG: M42 family metallopeptidase [Anaerolineae bacterium]|nr:MAG: M42 family metallopeptidase [Anaerolineae bacterium]
MKDLIRKLVEAWGPSGFEHQVRELIRNEVEGLADEIRVDALGNLICRVGKAKKNGLKIMVAAHMDEIGLMVSHIDRDGFLRFTNIGGLLQNTLFGNRVKFENGVIGTIGVEHGLTNRQRNPSMTGFFVDVSESVESNADIKVGDAAILWRTMDERGSRLIAKSIDNRISCAVSIETMKRLKKSPHEVYFVFTVQEEVGSRGAQVAAYGIEPDLGLAVDVTSTGDVPKTVNMDVELGKGVAIKVMDVKHIVPPEIKKWMVDTAEKHKIPYQLEVLTLGTTDSETMQLARAGVPCGTVSIPTRYVHSVSETVDYNDVLASVDLLTALLSNPVKNAHPV